MHSPILRAHPRGFFINLHFHFFSSIDWMPFHQYLCAKKIRLADGRMDSYSSDYPTQPLYRFIRHAIFDQFFFIGLKTTT